MLGIRRRRRLCGDIWQSAHSLVCALFNYNDLVEKNRGGNVNRFVPMHLCHNASCLNRHHLTYGLRLNNKNMLHLPHLPGYHQLRLPESSHDYYWLVIESMKEVLIGDLHDENMLKGTGLYSKARHTCRQRAIEILSGHLSKCEIQD